MQALQRRTRQPRLIRGVEEGDRCRGRDQPRQRDEPGGVELEDGDVCPLGHGPGVTADGGQRDRVQVDEGGEGGAARERFEAIGPGSGEHVDHREAGVGVERAAMIEDVEHRLAQAVAARPHRVGLGHADGAAAVFAGNDPHGEARLPSCSSRTLFGTEATSPRGRLPNWNGP